MSADGRYLLFASSAYNLAVTSSNSAFAPSGFQRLNVYLRDRANNTTTLVSVNLAGTGGGDGDSVPAGLSADGRYALFESLADDLIPGDTNNAGDVFLRDMSTGNTVLVSATTNGGWANGASSSAVMTPDGRYVGFSSAANNLVANDTNRIPDVFVRDMSTGITLLVSPGASAAGPTGYSSDSPEITPDGRYVAFLSNATNLVAQPTSTSEVYLRDTLLGVTYLASAGAHDWLGTNILACSHRVSADGQYVAYQANPPQSTNAAIILRYNVASGLSDLVSSNAVLTFGGLGHVQLLDMTPDGRFVAFLGQPDGVAQSTNLGVYRWDGQAGTTLLVSAEIDGAATTNAICDWPVMDQTGRYICFLSTATNLTTNIVAGEFHLYIRDAQAGTTRLLDLGPNSAAGAKAFLTVPRLTPGARWLAFDCTDSDLVPNDNNQAYDVFVCDLDTGAFELESVRQPGLPSQTPVGSSSEPMAAVSADGRFVAFASNARNLTPNSTNASQGLYLRDTLAGTNLLVSAGTNGIAVTSGWSTEPSISADGRYVAFTSGATNLAPGDATASSIPRANVFVRDMQMGTNYLVSVNSSGVGAGNQASYSPRISAGGLRVMFRSRATSLVPAVLSGENCFFRDLQVGRTYAVTTAGSSCSAMTPDGRFVAYGRTTGGMGLWDAQVTNTVYTFSSTALVTNIAVSPDGNRLAGLAGSRLVLVDRAAGTNATLAATASTAWLSHATLQFSTNGQFLVYVTAAGLVAGDTNSSTDVYLYDFDSQTNLLVSQSCTWPGAANGASDSAAISPDGRFIAYRSLASDLVPGDTNGVPDVFLYDRKTGSTTLLSVSTSGDFAANNRSGFPVFSADGQTIVFQSWASDLVPQDFNQSGDVFALSLAAASSIPAFSVELFFPPSAGGLPTLRWPAQPGASYRVLFKDDLNEPVWQELYGSVSLVGASGFATDLFPGNGTRFYRIVGF